MRSDNLLFGLSCFACGMAFIVTMAGAYTRLSDAGLGCPDWPGCYGSMIVSEEPDYIERATSAYPDRPLDLEKAWIEMGHRYVAGLLGLLILGIAVIAWAKRESGRICFLVNGLVLLVLFQSLLGMWTVTLLLKPLIVVLHLLGGMAIISLLYWLVLELLARTGEKSVYRGTGLFPWALTGLAILIVQIFLGGWTSANYAALACPDFPGCQGRLWPEMNFHDAFVLWRGLGLDYEGGVLDGATRTAIHITHRIGAVVVLITLSAVALRAVLTKTRAIRKTGMIILVLLFIQMSLGIANVTLHLPLYIAVAHNGVATLLLLSVLTLFYQSGALIIIRGNQVDL